MKKAFVVLSALGVACSACAAWYDNPTVKAMVAIEGATANSHPHFMNKASDDSKLMLNMNASGDVCGLYLFDISELRASSGLVSGLAKKVVSKPSDGYGTDWKGGAISSDLNMMIVGNGTSDGVSKLKTDVSSWTKGTDITSATLTPYLADGMDFGSGSTFLYSNAYTLGHRNKIVRWTFADMAKSAEKESVFVTRIRNISVHHVGDRELVYYGEGDDEDVSATAKVCVMDVTDADPANWVETKLSDGLDGFAQGDITNVKLDNEDGMPILYVLSDTGRLAVCQLATDGKSIERIVSIFDASTVQGWTGVANPPEGQWHFRNFEVTRDGTAAFILHRNGTETSLSVVASGGGAVKANVLSGETLSVQGSRCYTYYQFCVRKIVNTGDEANKNKFQLSELAFYDDAGERIGLNLADVGDGRDACSLSAGQFSAHYASGSSAAKDEEKAKSLFDGKTNTKCCLKGFCPSPADEATWLRIFIRLADGSAPVAGYNLATGNDTAEHPERNPVAWTLYGSDDGLIWTELSKVSEGAQYAAKGNEDWFNERKPIRAKCITEYRVQQGGTLSVNGNFVADSLHVYGGLIRIENDSAVCFDVASNDVRRVPGGGFTGKGSLVKDGSGILEVGGLNDYTGITEVRAGTLRFVPMHVYDQGHSYEFTIQALDGRPTGEANKFQLSEFALYDMNGERINLNNLTMTNDNIGCESLLPGCFSIWHDAGVSTEKEPPTKIFDGDMSTKWVMKEVNPTPTGYQIHVNLRLPSEIPAVASYNLATANDTAEYPNRNPAQWKINSVEVRGGSAKWTTLDSFDHYPSATIENQTWFNNGGAYPIANRDRHPYAREAEGPYIRFSIMKKASDADSDRKVLQFSELAIFDAVGNRLNLNMIDKGAKKEIAALTPGSFTYDYGSGAQCSTEGESAAKLFDGRTDTKLCIKPCTADPASPSSWCVITMRLADGLAPAVAYNLATANDTNENPVRNPAKWKVETSVDGVLWTAADEVMDASGIAITYNQSWFNCSYPIGFTTGGSRGVVPSASEIRLSGGTTVEFPSGVEHPVSAMRLDISATKETVIKNFSPSVNCVIDLVGDLFIDVSPSVLPVRLIGEYEPAVVAKCRVTRNGRSDVRYRLGVDSNGYLTARRSPGFIMIFR